MEAEALRRVGESVTAEAVGDGARSALLTAAAERILGGAALRAIYRLCLDGQLPEVGTAAWERVIEMARSGDIEIATVVRVRQDKALRDAATPAPQTSAPVAMPVPEPELSRPGALTDSFRAMGLLSA